MMLAALAFALQGVSFAYAKAGEALESGLAIWHVHKDANGSRHVHAHGIDKDGGGHYDHNGKLKSGSCQVVGALPVPVNALLAITLKMGSLVLLPAQLPSGLDPGGLKRPPRTPDIA